MNFEVDIMKNMPKNIIPITKRVIHEGGNSTVCEWENQDGCYIVKKFAGRNKNISERFEREKSSLILLEHNGIKNVPKLLYSDFDAKIIITTKLPGIKPKKMTLDIFIEYNNMTQLLGLNNLVIPEGLQIRNASDSLLEPIKLIAKIKKELNSVKEFINKPENKGNQFYSEIEYIIDEGEKAIKKQTGKLTINSEQEKIFSFSDIGPRNMLVGHKGLYFLDFEHAGWDDPIKGAIDLLICPTNNIMRNDEHKIAKYVIINSKKYKSTQRLLQWLPILNIKWVIIYIKYNLKLQHQKSMTMDEVQAVYFRGKRIIEEIKDMIGSDKAEI